MVVINGSLDNLQSSLDFFLSITSKNTIADSKEMKDRFFTMFKNEDSYRDENFLMFQERVSDDYDIVENPTPSLVGEEEVYSCGSCSFADDVIKEEEYPNDSEVYTEDDYEDEFIEYDCDGAYLENEKTLDCSYSNELDNEKIELDNEIDYSYNEEIISDMEKNELENENIELDDDEFVDYSYSEEENVNLETESDNSYVSEDLDEFEEEDFGWGDYDEEEEVIEEVVEEVGWGSYDEEEEVEEVAEEIPSVWDSDEDAEDEFPSWGNKNYEEEESIWGDVDETLARFDNSINIVEEEEVEKPKNKVVEVKKEVVEEVVNVPKDLRDFVKLYHNCEMSFALKYFTKKEIDKQLSLGRVFKRKNRLLI